MLVRVHAFLMLHVAHDAYMIQFHLKTILTQAHTSNGGYMGRGEKGGQSPPNETVPPPN